MGAQTDQERARASPPPPWPSQLPGPRTHRKLWCSRLLLPPRGGSAAGEALHQLVKASGVLELNPQHGARMNLSQLPAAASPQPALQPPGSAVARPAASASLQGWEGS